MYILLFITIYLIINMQNTSLKLVDQSIILPLTLHNLLLF